MFILTSFDLKSQSTDIVSVHNELIDAIESMHLHVSIYTNPSEYKELLDDLGLDSEAGTYEIIVKSDSRIEIIKKSWGYFSNYKDLNKILEIKQFDGIFQDL